MCFSVFTYLYTPLIFLFAYLLILITGIEVGISVIVI